MVIPYTIKELGHLIQICGKNGVTKLNLGEVAIEFSRETPEPAVPVFIQPKDTVEMEKVEAESDLEREIREREDELSRLQIDDPGEFEQMLIHREVSERGESDGVEEVL